MDFVLLITNSVHSFIVLVTTYLHKTGFCKWKKVKTCFFYAGNNVNLFPEQLYV